MPKELTHIVIAEASKQAFLKQKPDTALGQSIIRQSDHFRFGAVMHDIAFCASSSPMGDTLKQKGRAAHGATAKDIRKPFMYLSDLYDQTGNPEILAMLAGAVAHMMADSVFHPFVYYVTGHEIARHYLLETLIDTHVSENQRTWLEHPVSTLHLYRNLKNGFNHLAVHLTRFLDLPETYQPEIVKALNLHAFTLQLFRSRIGYHLFRLYSFFRNKEFKDKLNLFYPPGMTFETPFFKCEFTYSHPVNGETRKGPINELIETAIRQASELFERLNTEAENRSLSTFFSDYPVVSFETGLDPALGKEFHYTDLSLPVDVLVSSADKLSVSSKFL